MAALTGSTPSATYLDLLQISNSNGGIDSTLRNISDGGGTNSPLQLSATAGAWASGTFTWNGTVNFDAATVSFANDAIAMTDIDWSGTDTMSGTFTVTGTMDMSAGTITLPDNNVDLAQMAHGTQGDLLYYGASGDPTRLPAGTAEHPLVTKGAGANPAFQELATAGIANGAVTLAKQANMDAGHFQGRETGAGAGAPQALTPAQALTILDTARFESAETTVTAGDQDYTLAHGLGAAPRDVRAYLICKTTDNGWSVGDEVEVSNSMIDISGAGTYAGAVIAANSTNVIVTENNNFWVPNKGSSNTPTAIDYNDWKLVVRATL